MLPNLASVVQIVFFLVNCLVMQLRSGCRSPLKLELHKNTYLKNVDKMSYTDINMLVI